MNLLENLQISDLPIDQRDIAELIGITAYKQLVQAYGGTRIYIQKSDRLTIEIRNSRISEEYNGYNIGHLAIKWGLSESSIRDIISGKKRYMIENQEKLF